jgi:hypothetical protein
LAILFNVYDKRSLQGALVIYVLDIFATGKNIQNAAGHFFLKNNAAGAFRPALKAGQEHDSILQHP